MAAFWVGFADQWAQFSLGRPLERVPPRQRGKPSCPTRQCFAKRSYHRFFPGCVFDGRVQTMGIDAQPDNPLPHVRNAPIPGEGGLSEGIRGFSQRVLRYFLAFLETDFKRQQAPRRRIQLKTDTNFRSGMPLRKYRTLYDAVWRFVQQPTSEGLTLRVKKGSHTAPISPILLNLIKQQVAELPSESFQQAREQTIEYAKRNHPKSVDNPEQFVESVQIAFVEAVGTSVVHPILALLDGPFREQAYSAVESVYEVETDLTDALSEAALAQLPETVNTYIVKGETAPMETVLAEFFPEKDTRERTTSFFEDFATADAFQELRDVLNYVRTGENLQLYLYLCDLRFGNAAFPLFYIPATPRFDESKAEYVLEFDPHLFVNKQAVDWILQEHKGASGRTPVSPIDDRIIYLGDHRSFVDEMELLIRKLVPSLEIASEIDLRKRTLQSASSPYLKLSTTAYFAAFDKADEALLNDYEALLTAVTEDQQGAGALFENIIRGFLVDDPVSVRDKVDDQWENTPIPERLLAVSPIPINKEQRKILAALEEPQCRYLAIQGPPGTGKSHTITAIAFNCILARLNILILSDKQEALDVVEDKLNATLSAVRHGDDFPNPILRLGRDGGSYNRLISLSNQERIRAQYRAHKSNAERIQTETSTLRDQLKESIEKTVRAYSEIKLGEIAELERLEREIERIVPDYVAALQIPANPTVVPLLAKQLVEMSKQADYAKEIENLVRKVTGSVRHGSLHAFLTEVRIHAVASGLVFLRDQPSLALFDGLRPSQRTTLLHFVSEYQLLRLPLFGYLFSGRKVRALNQRLARTLSTCTNPIDLHKRLSDLVSIAEVLGTLDEAIKRTGLDDAQGEKVYKLVLRSETVPAGIQDFHRLLETFYAAFPSAPLLAYGKAPFPDVVDFTRFIFDAAKYACLYHKIHHVMNLAPVFDYCGEKARLEQMHAAKMTFEIDRRFIDFVDNKRATAQSLGAVIKAKQQFPQEEFEGLKEAFPCVIAGIREFAEYVPLKQKIFDVVVIDEASQVSVAQAFPALLRAKKVVVFGDKLQFSNVKSAQASNAVNDAHLADIEAHFRQKVSKAADRIQRLKTFDVKKSVLDFFELIASYSDMLRKHFRGYQELISFSSKTFYGGQLQAIKVRGKPIEDVIRITVLEHDGRKERLRNTNTQEAEAILAELKDIADQELGITVGVITPFREQQQYLSRLLFNDAYGARFEADLRLKVMTFDSCQGEERDLIVYSMVATATKDLLNYVFPVELTASVDPDRVEESLKFQRLNVGFSRAKETMWFVLSKPVDQFHGSIGRALKHYDSILRETPSAESKDTDPSSPMEAKVLDWVKKTPFFQKNEDQLELIAQFPVGVYLRQLDPNYQHPAYRCDFLLRYQAAGRRVNIIIEYDGFAEHFVEHKKVHDGNYDRYYRPEDIERQMVIESYGYKFLRLNHFNMGSDPIQTISERLDALSGSAIREREGGLEAVARIREDAEALTDGEAKHCPKCEQVKPRDAFFDLALKDGKGGYGRICTDCKKAAKPSSIARSFIRGTKHGRWRKYRRY
jgi:AAA domain